VSDKRDTLAEENPLNQLRTSSTGGHVMEFVELFWGKPKVPQIYI
jgi:hypothetical protein